MKRNVMTLVAGLAAISLVSVACGDDDGGTAATTTTTNVTSSSGNGGSGGMGAGGIGAGGMGAGGGGGPQCLPATVYDDLFVVSDSTLCVVEAYEADVFVGTDMNFRASSPTWGAHGGPLLVQSGPVGDEDKLALTRLTANGAVLTAAVEMADLTIPGGFFLGTQAIDVPGTPWTMVSWTGAMAVGELIAIDNGSAADTFPMVGLFSGAAIGSGDGARLVHSGLTELDNNNPMLGNSALYAADFCAGPALCNQGTSQIAMWGSASGPVTADQDGNVIAVLTNPAFLGGDDKQEARGFAASVISQGNAPTAGDSLFTVDGFGYALAARSPDGNEPGWLMYQPFSPANFTALDVILQRYGVAGDALVPQGMPAAALTMTMAGTEVVLVADPEGRIWVGYGVSESPAKSRWFVLDLMPR